MLTTKNKGDIGEDIAVNYLRGKGFEIIERNYSTNVGEIDIIGACDGYLVFVEVKTRLNDKYGYAADAVNFHKRSKINQVASQYIKRSRLFDKAVRFDVVEVYTEDKKVVHYENAFDSFLRY